MALDAGMRLGPYEIVAPIGAGGMGEVYKAKDTRLDPWRISACSGRTLVLGRLASDDTLVGGRIGGAFGRNHEDGRFFAQL